jgi:peptidylprolyl isomerase
MKSRVVMLFVAAGLAAAPSIQAIQAQTSTQPSATAAKPATTATSTAKTTSAARATGTASAAVKLPPGVPPARGILKTSLSLKYQDIKIGAGPLGEEGKIWHVKYTGWRAADGVKFDSWDQHKMPVIKDGKPVQGPDGKPQFDEPKPLEFPHAVGRMIPGFDLGVEGMRVGGKRRVFVPWALAYGYRAIPDRGPDHPGIPAKSDLIFDVELVEVTDAPPPPQRPVVPGGGVGHFPGSSIVPPKPGAPAAPGTAPKPAAPATPGTPSAPATTAPATTAPATTLAPSTTPKPATPPQSK